MTCNHCGRALRWDEEQRPVLLEGIGQVWCCPDCMANAQGLDPPKPKRYPVGSPIPNHPLLPAHERADMPICGLCRIALPWGQDKGTLLRIRDEEILDEEVSPGAYRVCSDCLRYWRPRVLAYLQRLCRKCNVLDCEQKGNDGHQRMLPANATERQVVGGMLS